MSLTDEALMNSPDSNPMEHHLKYAFNHSSLLEEALRHSSYVNEQADPDLSDNECLEFLGDAVLNLVVSHLLMIRFPELREGDLSRIRANLVNEKQLADISRSLKLGRFVKLGKGEERTHGREKNSILANTLEAVIAAVYLDGGFSVAFKIIETRFSDLLDATGMEIARQDYKSLLQEWVQGQQESMPVYQIIGENGPDHDKTFRVQLTLPDLITEGVGKSKKTAQQEAAKKALAILKGNDHPKDT